MFGTGHDVSFCVRGARLEGNVRAVEIHRRRMGNFDTTERDAGPYRGRLSALVGKKTRSGPAPQTDGSDEPEHPTRPTVTPQAASVGDESRRSRASAPGRRGRSSRRRRNPGSPAGAAENGHEQECRHRNDGLRHARQIEYYTHRRIEARSHEKATRPQCLRECCGRRSRRPATSRT